MMVHGGSWNAMPDDVVDAHAAGCLEAVNRGRGILEAGGGALDAVEAAIVVLEDDPTFDAGHGSFPTTAGEVELDAALMDGAGLDVGAVACVIGIPNPVRLARLILEAPQVLLAGPGAREFAERHGLPTCTSDELLAPAEHWDKFFASGERRGPSDTVGAVARDAHGNIVAGLSTGGQPNRIPGRVGDVPQVGCGYYADSTVGGVACSGWGEAIARVTLANRAMRFLESGQTAQQAADNAIRLMRDRVGGFAGILVVDPDGAIGISFHSACFARGWWTEGMEKPMAAVRQEAWTPR
jgi:beta-aspartyl-peptidase (threonine type)